MDSAALGERPQRPHPSVPGLSCQCSDSTRIGGNLELACSEGQCDWNHWAVPHTCPSVPEAPLQAEGWAQEAHSAALVPCGIQWWCSPLSSLPPACGGGPGWLETCFSPHRSMRLHLSSWSHTHGL
ncbi:unnamed protein product [Rangifer tarandus platyrhynchus]|uniref:Uncharacterized protein n=1 Tax=Rangifer tarandus platyrhynchus TaxID=3082113 RepID=A0AC59Z7F1_RANTA